MNRSFIRMINRSILPIGCGLALCPTAPASATPLPPIVALAPAVVAATSGVNRVCVYTTYDKNGNRLTQAVSSATTTQTVWGTGTYGCFLWKA
jgi:hypothetical protein